MLVRFKYPQPFQDYPQPFQGYTGSYIEMSDLPRPGDRVVFTKTDRPEDIYRVDYVEWYPQGATPHPDDTDPTVYVITRSRRPEEV